MSFAADSMDEVCEFTVAQFLCCRMDELSSNVWVAVFYTGEGVALCAEPEGVSLLPIKSLGGLVNFLFTSALSAAEAGGM